MSSEKKRMIWEEQVSLFPVSPMGQYFNSSVLCLHIIGVLEFPVPLDHSQALPLLQRLFLPINPRFSSIMVEEGKSGKKQWKKVQVNLKDHINIPIFPTCNSKESYDNCFADYLSRIALEKLPKHRPLWEIHIVNYPTSSAASSLIFKLHHALGDGYSLMGALLSCLERGDDPSLPLSFPSLKPSSNSPNNNKSFFRRFCWAMSVGYNTLVDFWWGIMNTSVTEDDKSPIRSGFQAADETRPLVISTVTFPMDQIRLIKSSLGVTVNDVITGVIFYGTRRYMEGVNHKSRAARSTALILMNTRDAECYQSVNDMLSAKAKGPWGNKVSFLHVPIPKLEEDNRISNPLDFIWEVHHTIKKKKNSLVVPLNGMLLDMESKLKGYEEVAKHLHHATIKSSAILTSLIGPSQQMSLANHPVKGFYFTVVGGPESLLISIMSYMGVVSVTLKTDKYFIDEHKLRSHIDRAFQIMLNAALNQTP